MKYAILKKKTGFEKNGNRRVSFYLVHLKKNTVSSL